MAKTFTVDLLSAKLVEDFTWRMQEIVLLSGMAKKMSTPDSTVISRAAIAMTYAHWEGYIKSTSLRYLEFVAARRRRYRDLTNNFVLLGNLKNIDRLRYADNLMDQLEILNDISGMPEQTNRSDHSKRIQTRSNLTSDVFREICVLLGIEWKRYETDFTFLDTVIVERRNYVAHGQEIAVSAEEIVQNGKKVLALMRAFRDDVENLAFSRGYLATSNP